MSGEFGLPYRAPCGGWPAKQRWMVPAHVNTDHVAIRKWLNTTKVTDYSVVADPAGIRPYPRPDNQYTWPSCTGTEYPDVPECVPPPGSPPCVPWRPQGRKQAPVDTTTCPEADDEHRTRDFNCYTLSDPAEFQNVALCRKIGFKNVQAFKAWHGAFGFNDGPCCNPASGSRPKYLSITMYGEYGYSGGAPEGESPVGSGTCNAVVGCTYSVDRYSGVRTVSGCQDTYSSSGFNYPYAPDPEVIKGAAYELHRMRSSCEGGWSYTPGGFIDRLMSIITGGDTTAVGVNVIANTISNTELHLHVAWFALDAEQGWFHHNAEAHITLGDPYTADDVWYDVKTLLGHWRLDDDAVYPWRTDPYPTVAPLMTYDEAPPASPDIGTCGCAYVDPSAELYTGEIQGAPLTQGYGPHFDWNHRTWRCCQGDAGYNKFYPYYHGAHAAEFIETGDITDSFMPRTATQWTENYGIAEMSNAGLGEAPGILYHGDMRAGAWVIHLHGRGIYAQEWAETLLSWPSVNFNRPCGIDRGAFDSDASECVNTIEGGNLVLESDIPVSTGDHCYYGGGIYKVTKVGDGIYSLGAMLCAAPGWVNEASGGTNPSDMLCKIRWFGAKPMCQSANVLTAVDNGDGTVTITTDRDVYLYGIPAEESLDFTDVPGLENPVFIDSVTSLREFKVAGSLTEEYASGGNVTPVGYDVANDKWNDDNSKRDFIRREWDEAETVTETADCLFPKPCAPSVLAYLPPGHLEEFPNGKIFDMRTASPDECASKLWCADFLQATPDPFWKAPPTPCGDVDAEIGLCVKMAEDGGDCSADYTEITEPWCDVKFYPSRPYVEPLLAAPTGAPSLPADVTLHAAPGSTPPTSSSIWEADNPTPKPLPGPWILWGKIWSQIQEASSCRWKAYYEKWFKGCC